VAIGCGWEPLCLIHAVLDVLERDLFVRPIRTYPGLVHSHAIAARGLSRAPAATV